MSGFKRQQHPAAAPQPAGERRSGRATWDERGNSVWEWQTEAGVFKREITARELESLEAPDLELMPDESTRNIGVWLRG